VAGSDEERTIAAAIDEEANRAMLRGAAYLAILGLLCSLLLCTVLLLGIVRDLWVPAIFSLIGGLYSLLVVVFARGRRIVGWRSYTTLLPLVSLPTVFFLLSHGLMPGGAATFLNGPFAGLYFVLIAATGFFFDARLARISGALAAVEYLGCVLLALPRLNEIRAPDPATEQDLRALPIYLFKCVMMVSCGFVVGALAEAARRLLLRILHEEREKTAISRLFGQFVSPEVKEKIIRERAGAVGERKHVVLLFSDIRSFTGWCEQADPAVLVERLNQYFDAMVGAITSRGGVVDKFIGDAVMATFGGVLAIADPAGAALDAAREMRRRLAALNERWQREGARPIDNGIGLHAGEVLQGTIGSAERKEFTVIGDPVNTAARIESLTREQDHPVLVSAAFVDELPAERRAECALLGNFKLKGKEKTVDIFYILNM